MSLEVYSLSDGMTANGRSFKQLGKNHPSCLAVCC